MPTERELHQRRLVAMVAVSALMALICAVANSGVIGGFPPKPRPHNLQIAAASGFVSVDLPSPMPSIAHRRSEPPLDLQTIVKRAELLGRVAVSPPVLERIAARCGVAPNELSGVGRTTANVPIALTEPSSERRASDIRASTAPYRLEVQARPTLPIIALYTQAPTVQGATCVADSVPEALTDYLQALARAQGSVEPLAQLRSIGPARGATVNGGATISIAVLTFITVFGLAFVALFSAGRVRRLLVRRSQDPDAARELLPPLSDVDDRGDSWPHTTRMLPWLLAVFVTVLWLTPFNNIELNASLPIELRLDRLVLPFIALLWLLGLVSGGRVAPRLRLTWIHIALGALLACAFLSVVTDARYLNQSLELDLSLKKLPLLLSYVSLFLIVSSGVRRNEVRPFMTYMLVLSVVVAVGMVWEYRMKQNLFWEYSDKLLPGMFRINGANTGGAFDHLGRPIVRGPAEVPLEAVAMLTMAMSIALVRLLHEVRWRQRLVYGIVICALVAATFATYRKSALVAPASVVVLLAYFRRRELLKLAPLGMVLLVIVSVVSPGALGSTISQFTRSDATAVPTVSDRTADYDAVRPDVWSHIVFGRGWGSYNHDSYRILDSEILSRLIEVGVVGLLAFIMLSVTVVVASKRVISARDPRSAPIALIGASVAIAFLIFATLFDVLSFPHATYIFLFILGLETLELRRPEPARRPPPEPPAAAETEYAPRERISSEARLVRVR